jgi:hypothetical protein
MEKHVQNNEFTRNVNDLAEWQDHQYGPYYYTGGRVPPFYKRPRPNKFGYGLVVAGLLFVLGTALTIVPNLVNGGLDFLSIIMALFFGTLGAVQIASGLRLLGRI